MSFRQHTITNLVKQALGTSLAFCVLLSSSVLAIESRDGAKASRDSSYVYSRDSGLSHRNAISSRHNPYSSERPVLNQGYAQNKSRGSSNNSNSRNQNVRSQSDVMREVKRRYNADVLKITLNQKGSHYRVKILMPDRVIKEVTVSASR